MSEKLSAKERLVLPLDSDSLDDAKRLIRELKNHVGLFKVGLTLFVSHGFQAIEAISKEVGDNRVFFDLKFLDIPHTVGSVSGALISVHGHGVKFVTVHTSEGERIIKAAVDAVAKGTNGTRVIGITVLTSMNDHDLRASGLYPQQTVEERVLFLAGIANNAGAAGVVCSGHEARAVKRKFGEAFLVIAPGIRPRWSSVTRDDQRRVMTPSEAIQAGVDYIVVGRPISQSPDRVGAAQRVLDEIESALSSHHALA